MNRTDVQGTLREMWETRPARPREGRQWAGVASAIARRYDIDPVLVRVGFVVAAFSGIGAALYIAGWAMLPDEPGTGPPPRAPKPVLLIALVAVTVGSVFGGGRDILLPTLAVAALLFLLHRSRGDHQPAAVDPAGVPAGPSLLKEPTAAAQQPPAWDPLGAAPFAWDLPEPTPVAPPAPRPRRFPVTAVTLAVALLAGGLTALIMLLAGALSLANLPVLFGVVLAVVGLGLVGGAFIRSGRGLIPIALLLSALTWAAVAAPLDRWQGHGFGDIHFAPTTVAELQPSYQRTAGQFELDLRHLDLTVPASGNDSAARSSISVGAGDVQVLIPRDADLTLTASTDVGHVAFGTREDSGFGARIDVTDDLGADGVRSGRPLVLQIEAGAGNVEVHRG